MSQERPALEVRQRHYNYDDSIPKYYDSGNPVLTHEWNALALIIPPGERYFVRSVKRLAHRVTDPVLQLQIKGFIGQEAMHSKETERSLEILEKQGIPARKFEDWYDRFLSRLERFSFPRLHLSGTAACEHWTAIISLWQLKTRYCDRMPPTIRDLWQWHGAEELEHKAVTFDLLQAVVPRNYLLRMAGFLASICVNWIGYRKAMRMLLKSEGLTRAQIREERRRARKIRIPLMGIRFPHLWDYLRPGFHPKELDDGGVVNQVLADQASRAGA